MNIRRYLACAVLVALTGCQGRTQSPVDTAADIAAIREYNAQWLKALSTGDSKLLSSLTAEEHITFPPNQPPNVGKAANDAVNAKMLEQYAVEEIWNPQDQVVAGDWAYERGSFTATMTPKAGGATQHFSGNYLRILKRQADGSWKMIREMANSDRPDPQPNAASPPAGSN